MNFIISNFLKKYSSDVNLINRLLVTSFVRFNSVVVKRNKRILCLLIAESDEDYNAYKAFSLLINAYNMEFSFEDLINCFECVLSPENKVVNGAVYTPFHIRKYIVDAALKDISKRKLPKLLYADLSCGCGSFFLSLLQYIQSKCSAMCSELFPRLYGVDIEEYSIERTKILLSLYALLRNEDLYEFEFNLKVGNSLTEFWKSDVVFQQNSGFDVILGNPPYVSSSKIDDETKKLLERWTVSRSGKADLYIPFFQLALESLKENGILGYITVNNFYRSVNGRNLREYFSQKEYFMRIVDFGSEQIFKGRSTYTCICLIQNKHGNIFYGKCKSTDLEQSLIMESIPYTNLNNAKGWLLSNNRNVISNIFKIEHTGTPLEKVVDIKNGFATLKNDVYLFTPFKEDDTYFFFMKNGKQYKAEKKICRAAIKPNTLKKNIDLFLQAEQLIFPYIVGNGESKLIAENIIRKCYPRAYEYLCENKEVLAKRDKGKRLYPEWYAYGRTQALSIYGYKLLFPYLASKPLFVLSEDKNLLYYNGYALVSEDLELLKFLQKVLSSKIFWYYIQNSSKPYNGEFMSLAKNYLKNFGIADMSKEERTVFDKLVDKEEIDNFLMKIYDLKF